MWNPLYLKLIWNSVHVKGNNWIKKKKICWNTSDRNYFWKFSVLQTEFKLIILSVMSSCNWNMANVNFSNTYIHLSKPELKLKGVNCISSTVKPLLNDLPIEHWSRVICYSWSLHAGLINMKCNVKGT